MNMTSGIPRTAATPAAPAATPTNSAERVPPSSADPYRLAYGVLGIVGVILAFLLIRFTIDDAFISWRYGQSLLDGAWNWNPTDTGRVEAYSDPLYTALSAVPAALGLIPELFFKLVGLGLIAGYLLVVHRVLEVPRLQKLLLTAFAVANPVFFVHAFSGLETASFALLLAALFGLLYTRGRLDALGHVLVLAVALSRPEGMVYALVAELWCLHLNRRRADAVAAGGVLALLASYWLLRDAWFHSFFPNSYLLKSGAGATDVVAVAHAVVGLLGMVLLAGVLAGAAEVVRRVRTRRRGPSSSRPVSPWRDATPAVLAGVSSLIIMVLYRVSALQMDFANRFCWQLLFPVALVLLSRPLFTEGSGGRAAPLVRQGSAASAEVTGVPGPAAPSARWSAFALLIAAITAYTGTPGNVAVRGTITLAAGLAVVLALVLWASGSRVLTLLAAAALVTSVSAVSVAEILDWSTYRLHLQNAQEAVGTAIAADGSLTGVVAVEDAGVLPAKFRPDQWALDLGGVADPFLNKPVPAAITDHLVAMVVGAGGPLEDPWGGDSSTAPVFAKARAAHFRPVAAVMYAPGYWLRLYVKPGLGKVAAQRLSEAWQSADIPDNELSSSLLSQHLFDLPFLHG
ncbi:MAG TPA: hypothetical protein VL551_01135 [Actinospica sp.]|jgi:hypothetical protein|nr:hypothetical protein [Actinospica sp.]